MTPFQQQLAAFEQWAKVAEPKIAPQVTDVINRYYRGPVNFAGRGMGGFASSSSSTSIDSLIASGQWADLSSSGSSTAAPAAATTNILSQLVSTAGNLVNNQQTAQQKLNQLNATAQIAAAQASGAASTNQTMLLIGAALAAVVVVGLVANRR